MTYMQSLCIHIRWTAGLPRALRDALGDCRALTPLPITEHHQVKRAQPRGCRQPRCCRASFREGTPLSQGGNLVCSVHSSVCNFWLMSQRGRQMRDFEEQENAEAVRVEGDSSSARILGRIMATAQGLVEALQLPSSRTGSWEMAGAPCWLGRGGVE